MHLFNKFFISSSLLCAGFMLNTTYAQEDTQSINVSQPIFTGEHKPFYIGEIGEKWQFPSDHLPRGMSVGNLHIAFWNILNKNYLHHIEENTQGLRNSSILTDNVPANNGSTLTLRELQSIEIIFGMINHPTHPRSIIGLEETHGDVLQYLKKNLPSNWVVANPPGQPNSQDLYLYDTNVFEFVNVRGVRYTENMPKCIFTLTLREKTSGEVYRFVQSHIPGGPSSAEGCAKFANEAIKQFNANETTILMGDMNASPTSIKDALRAAATKAGFQRQPYYYLPIDHPSHINTKLEAAWIDNFFIYRPKIPGKVLPSHLPTEVHQSLEPIVDLFRI